MIDFVAREQKIRQQAREWLESGEVKYVIGYEKGKDSAIARPVFIRNPADADKLCGDPTCINNLTKYLVEEVQRTTEAVWNRIPENHYMAQTSDEVSPQSFRPWAP